MVEPDYNMCGTTENTGASNKLGWKMQKWMYHFCTFGETIT